MKPNPFFPMLLVAVIIAMSGSADSGTYTFIQSTPFVFGDATISSNLLTTGVMGNITDVNVTLNGLKVNNFNDGIKEFDILLVSPMGQKVILMSFACKATPGPLDFTFDDAASGPLPSGFDTFCVSGTYRPSDYSVLAGGYILDPPAPPPPYSTVMDEFNGFYENGEWKLWAREFAGNQGGTIDNWTLTIETDSADCPNPPLILTILLEDGTLDVPYGKTVEAAGGTPPYSWSVDGFLPPGLSINSTTGAITGTPASAGIYPFNVQVVDSVGCVDSASFVLTINDPENCANPPQITTSTLPNGSLGTPYNQSVQATGGTPPYSWSAIGELPDGLLLDPLTGAITGTPTESSTSFFTVVVTDSLGCFDSQFLAIEIFNPLCMYENDFNDGVLEWSEEKPTVVESGGFLNLSPLKRKAIAVADAAFSGASAGTYTYSVQFTGSTFGSKNWLYINRVDKKNQLEILAKIDQGKVVIKDRLGSVQAKAKGNFTLVPNTPYTFVTNYDGNNVGVTINGTPVIQDFVPSRVLPIGYIGAATKNSMAIDNFCFQ